MAAAVGPDRAVGLVMSSISVAMWEAGKVERPGNTETGSRAYRIQSWQSRGTDTLDFTS
ncbi:MAG: hypothetical protein Ct9H300mP19_07140 [Dehalococcoidia bacterium]|nr:MAG: hypothetical protein Ct9H300mP19_07140 [Dehalococcoidia bacterium]